MAFATIRKCGWRLIATSRCPVSRRYAGSSSARSTNGRLRFIRNWWSSSLPRSRTHPRSWCPPGTRRTLQSGVVCRSRVARRDVAFFKPRGGEQAAERRDPARRFHSSRPTKIARGCPRRVMTAVSPFAVPSTRADSVALASRRCIVRMIPSGINVVTIACGTASGNRPDIGAGWSRAGRYVLPR